MTTFDEWWDTLTPAEQKVIGRTNAKYVWLEACAAEREACAKVCEKDATAWGYDSNGASCAIAIRARGQA